MNKTIISILLFLNFNSALSPFTQIYIEHYPYGFILALYAIFTSRKINHKQITILLLISSIFIVSLCIYLKIYEDIPIIQTKYFLSYINFIAPVFFIDKINRSQLFSVVRIVFISSILIGLLQYTNMLNIIGINLDFAVSRFRVGSIGGYRGVSLLETEPARASYLLFCSAAILSSMAKKRYFIIIACIVDFTIIRSTSGFILYFLYFSMILIISFKPTSIIIWSIALFTAVYNYNMIVHQYSKVKIILDALMVTKELKTSFYLLYDLSGGRIHGILNALYEIISFPFGKYAFSESATMQFNKIEGLVYSSSFSNTTPASGLILYAAMFGIFFIYQIFIMLRNRVKSKSDLISLLPILLPLLVYSPPGSSIGLLTLLIHASDFNYIDIKPKINMHSDSIPLTQQPLANQD